MLKVVVWTHEIANVVEFAKFSMYNLVSVSPLFLYHENEVKVCRFGSLPTQVSVHFSMSCLGAFRDASLGAVSFHVNLLLI